MFWAIIHSSKIWYTMENFLITNFVIIILLSISMGLNTPVANSKVLDPPIERERVQLKSFFSYRNFSFNSRGIHICRQLLFVFYPSDTIVYKTQCIHTPIHMFCSIRLLVQCTIYRFTLQNRLTEHHLLIELLQRKRKKKKKRINFRLLKF